MMFDDLPPRVVVHDIFSFFSFPAGKKCNHEYDLYGYFGKDYSRNVWMMFRSVELEANGKVYLDHKKLESLVMVRPSKFDVERLILLSPEMNSLRKLTFQCFYDSPGSVYIAFPRLFQNPSSFPSLQNFRFYSEPAAEVFVSSWKNSPIWKRLRSFNVFGEFTGFEQIFKIPNNFRELEYANLYGIEFPEKTEIHLPSLKSFRVSGCKNMVLTCSRDLKSVKLNVLDELLVKEYLLNISSVEELTLNTEEEEVDISFLCKFIIPRVRNRLFLYGIDLSSCALISFLPTLTHLKFFNLKNFDGDSFFQKYNFPSLRHMTYSNSGSSLSFGKVPWGKNSDNLKELDILYSEIDSSLFHVNGWESLESLNLTEISFIGGDEETAFKKWNEMQNLQSLKLVNLPWKKELAEKLVGEGFFSFLPERGFPCLKTFQITRNLQVPYNVSGGSEFPEVVSTSFENVEYLIPKFIKTVEEMSFVGIHANDSLFRIYPLEKIRKLNICLQHVLITNELSGENWGDLLNLESLEIRFIPSFQDVFFQNQKLKNLKSLALEKLKGLKGRDWSCDFQSLQNLRICSLESFEVLSELVFPKLEILSCSTIPHLSPCDGWANLHFLKVLRVRKCPNVNIDVLLSKQKFSKLYHLEIEDSPHFTGSIINDLGKETDKKEFPEIGHVSIASCPNFSDMFFVNYSLPSLHTLHLIKTSEKLTFEHNSIQAMENLKNLILDDSEGVSDALFQKNLTPRLFQLVLGNCPNVKGIRWKKMKRLERFISGYLEGFENIPFPQDCDAEMY